MSTAFHKHSAGKQTVLQLMILPLILCVFLISLVNAARIDTAFAPATGIPDQSIRGFLTLQPDGKILVVGSFDYINGKIGLRIARLNSDLSVDPTFACDICGGQDVGERVVLQPDGKYLLSVRSTVDGAMKLYRLLENGKIDTSFVSAFDGAGLSTQPAGLLTDGSGRIIVIRLGPGSGPAGIYRLTSTGAVDPTFTPVTNNGTISQFYTQVSVLSDQKIMVSGAHPFGNLFRLNADGTKDFSFAAPTVSTTFPLTPYIGQFTLEPDGRISVAGYFQFLNGVARTGLGRINNDQGVDMTFNPSLTLVPTTFPNAIRRQSDGNYIVGASYQDGRKFVRVTSAGAVDGTYNSPADLSDSSYWTLDPQDRVIFNGYYNNEVKRISRLNFDGSKDPNFKINIALGGEVSAVATSPDGKSYVAGHFTYFDNVETNFLVRLNPNGTLDPSFNAVAVNSLDLATKLVVQADGRVIGMFPNNQFPIQQVKVMRFQQNGTVDPTYDFTIENGHTMTLQPDGKVLVGGGNMTFSGFARSGLLRININGTLDTPFNPGIGGTPNIRALEVQPDAKILIGGGFTSINGVSRTNFARLNAGGTLDKAFAGGSAARVSNIVRMSDGSIVVSAMTNVARYTTAGVVDGTFQAPTFNPVDTIDDFTIRSMVGLPNGSILVGGSFDSPAKNVVLLRSKGSADSTFVPGDANGRVDSLSLFPNGRILVGGRFKQFGGVGRLGIALILQGSSVFDFDGDGKTDIGIFRPNGLASEWWINRSSTGQTFALQFGAATDRITPADYTGDGKTDIAFFRPSSGEWYVLRSEDFSFFALPFGTNGDVPAPADYDADGKADFAVFRPSSSTWFISQSSGAPTRIVQFGIAGDQPVVADYDGDGKADIAIFRNAAGSAQWWIERSTAGSLALQFGSSTDKAVQGDYTGDGKADVAIWRPSTGEWFIVRSEDSSFYGFPFGASTDTVAHGDYDGDGKFDATVFRPSNATWFIARSTAGTQIVQFGATGDRPIPNAFVP